MAITSYIDFVNNRLGLETKKLTFLSKDFIKYWSKSTWFFEAPMNHEGTLALGGFFSYHISKESAGKIASGIIKKIGSIFDNAEAFKKTLLVSYERPIEEKAGLPSLIDLIENDNKTLFYEFY